MSEKLIPFLIGFCRVSLTRESVRLLLAALDDYTDGDLPSDLEEFKRILSS